MDPPGNKDVARLSAVDPRWSINSSVLPLASWAKGNAIFLVNANPLANGYSTGIAVATISRPDIILLVTGLSNTFSVNLPIVCTVDLIDYPIVLNEFARDLKNPIMCYCYIFIIKLKIIMLSFVNIIFNFFNNWIEINILSLNNFRWTWLSW